MKIKKGGLQKKNRKIWQNSDQTGWNQKKTEIWKKPEKNWKNPEKTGMIENTGLNMSSDLVVNVGQFCNFSYALLMLEILTFWILLRITV